MIIKTAHHLLSHVNEEFHQSLFSIINEILKLYDTRQDHIMIK